MYSATAFQMTVDDYADEQERSVDDVVAALASIYPNRSQWRAHDLLHPGNVEDLDHFFADRDG